MLTLKLDAYDIGTSTTGPLDRLVFLDTGGNFYTVDDKPAYLCSKSTDPNIYIRCRVFINGTVSIGETKSAFIYMIPAGKDLLTQGIDLVGPTFVTNGLFWYDATQPNVEFGLAPLPPL